MSELQHDLTVVADAIAHLTGDNKKPNIIGLLTAWLQVAQELEDSIWETYESRLIDVATDAQLDLLGVIVGALRNNLADTDYRTAIKIQIRVNRSKGRASDLVAIGVLAGVSPVYVQTGPAKYQITVQDGILPLAQAFGAADALGTGGDMISTADGAAALMWDTVAGSATSHWDDVADSLATGKWCEVTPL
jgi:hypothetical protein